MLFGAFIRIVFLLVNLGIAFAFFDIEPLGFFASMALVQLSFLIGLQGKVNLWRSSAEYIQHHLTNLTYGEIPMDLGVSQRAVNGKRWAFTIGVIQCFGRFFYLVLYCF